MENTYADGANLVCADCGFEWPALAAAGCGWVLLLLGPLGLIYRIKR